LPQLLELDSGFAARSKINTLMSAAGLQMGFDVWYDFQRDIVIDGQPYATASRVTDTHPDSIWVPNSAGVYSSASPNVLVRNDLGLWTQPARTNAVPNSQGSGVVGSSLPTKWGPNYNPGGLAIQVVSQGTENGLPITRIRFTG